MQVIFWKPEAAKIVIDSKVIAFGAVFLSYKILQ